MKARLLRRWRTLIPLLLLFAMASCADHCSRVAYDKVINERTESFQHNASADKVWSTAVAELQVDGIEIPKATPQLGNDVVTAWRGKEGERVRYHAKLVKGSPAGVFLEITKDEERRVSIYPDVGNSTVQPEPIGEKVEVKSERDLDVEWRVVKKLDPEAAVQIELAAAERAEQVRDVVASGCK